MLSSTASAQLPSCWYLFPSHLNAHHHAQQKRKLTSLTLANADRQVYNLCLSQAQKNNKGLESNYRTRYNFNLIQNHKYPFFQQLFPFDDTKDTNNQNSQTRKESQFEVDKHKGFKENNIARSLFTEMWWVDIKAAIGQRINLEGILCSAMVIVKSPKLALPHIAVPDIRYIDWAELRRKGFKGVVFDKDNTITAPYSLMPWPPLESSLERCKLEFGPDIAVFSNSAGLHEYDPDGSKARMLEAAVGIKVIRHKVKKPSGTAEEVEKHFGCESSKLIMVGDRPFTDIVYGNRNGFLTILTEPLSLVDEPFIVKQVRKLETTFVSYWCRRGLEPPVQKLLPNPMSCVKEPRP
ncbi:phosphatidylglycerophosphate phosphatase 1, chloroplastic/mitochondrial [Arachis stenosperma]|uniref:phosphatidylglycerophosphate phosphatase 1, chloroplastic/mitochondrial n=1 Tax=Arachis stenosperma TaxID=217475 RepID=UPI0025AC7B5B|nr:phosphatidylglycerophosphate phosphatase 1, chloroplastic/mitochondrial [Arachis stenosperma]XP_057758590.1 phosphatidylglycerophosphate phosphatase 1, chloroplastic/mitochondrial [Arachis stenosperma]